MKTVLAGLIAFAVLGQVKAEDGQFQVPFGIFAPQSANQPARLEEETLTIPLRLRETGLRWGFAIVPIRSGEYTWRAVFSLPSPPQSVGSVYHEVKRIKGSSTVSEVPLHHETEATAFVMSFDKGDPIGVWKIEVFINERLARTILFHVVEDK